MGRRKSGFSRKSRSKSSSKNRPSSTIPPDDVWRLYKGKKVRLAVKLLPEEKPEGRPSVLLEGNRTSLEWLADTILASAAYKQDCGFFVAPDGPGNIFFNKQSGFGIYIHRLPCLERGQKSGLPWPEVTSKRVKKPLSLQQMKEWRTREAAAGRPSSFADLCRAFGLCVTCEGQGVTRNDNGRGYKVVGIDGDTRLFEQCPVCGGTGMFRDSTRE